MEELKNKIKKSCGKGLSEIVDDIDASIRTKGGKVFVDLCMTMKDVIFDSLDDVKNLIKSKLEVDDGIEEKCENKEESNNEEENNK